ncbi:hypothetical protein [Aestuariivirga litoralis]|uniref:hypothetical protein n=1 Tax=Aestuariivirga litoralis TaxID=2650924 RepID=UPI0018C760B9|nr:hypothetical protein [Aestuariivirga litoralis]MBG1232293.1 hypothetical protein [Aestuariivirga litoralis]
MTHQVVIPVFGAFEAWREKARLLALNGVSPADIQWCRKAGVSDLFEAKRNIVQNPSGSLKVPRDFLGLAEEVVCSADMAAFSLLYRVLLRLQDDCTFLSNPADGDVHALSKIDVSVPQECPADVFLVAPDLGSLPAGGEFDNCRHSCALPFETECNACAKRGGNRKKRVRIDRKTAHTFYFCSLGKHG